MATDPNPAGTVPRPFASGPNITGAGRDDDNFLRRRRRRLLDDNHWSGLLLHHRLRPLMAVHLVADQTADDRTGRAADERARAGVVVPADDCAGDRPRPAADAPRTREARRRGA